ncbi:MAG: CBS domain-containing protein [Nitrospinae bacterium]|nr:CBS domain-containing protein [Nitrospinota bacterium]
MADFSTLLAVKDLMKPEIVTASVSVTVAESARIMTEKQISSIVLTDGEGKIAGLITETEIVRNVVAAGKDAGKTAAGDVMNDSVHMIAGDASIFDARHMMANLGVKHMVVESGGKPIGLVSATALLGS